MFHYIDGQEINIIPNPANTQRTIKGIGLGLGLLFSFSLFGVDANAQTARQERREDRREERQERRGDRRDA